MARIAVLGLGNFGTALARNWLSGGHEVSGWTVEQEVFDSVQATSINEKYLPDVPLKGLAVSMDIAATIQGAEIVVLALPSGVVLKVFEDLISLLHPSMMLFCLIRKHGP